MNRLDPRKVLTGVRRELRSWRRSGMLTAAIIGFAVSWLIAMLTLTMYAQSTPPAVEQPVAFNHRMHVEDVGLSCLDCHEYYESEVFSGFPPVATCAMCHEEAQGDSAAEAELVGLLSSGDSLAWKSLYLQPAHVFYSHRRHVVVAGIECDSCHDAIASSETPPSRASVLSMEDCLSCHEDQEAGVDCTTCHR